MKAFWSGTFNLGLLNMPIRVYRPLREPSLKLKLIHEKDSSPIRRVNVCELENKEISDEQIIKGYEYREGKFAVINSEDVQSLAGEGGKTMNVLHFVSHGAISPKYFNEPFYIEPNKEMSGTYALVRDALIQSKKMGIASFVFRGKEYLGAIVAEGNIIMFNRLRYESEMVISKEIYFPSKGDYSEEEMNLMMIMMNNFEKEFNPIIYRDTFNEKLKKLIEVRIKESEESFKGNSFVESFINLFKKKSDKK